MVQSQIVYVGPPELHDAHVVGVEREGDRATVRVRGSDQRPITLEFTGVTELSGRPEGMLLFGLAELRTGSPTRHFFFANSEEWDDAGLELTARDFRVISPE
jgi:hypothetical protein